MTRNRWRGTTHVEYMGPGDLCFIRVLGTDGSMDVIRGPSPEDFEGWYKGRVDAVEVRDSPPLSICAHFTDKRLKESDDRGMRALKGKEPPFAYEVRPRWRLQGLTGDNTLTVGEACVIQIADFDVDDALCENPGLNVDSIRRLFPTTLKGIWHGRIIQMTTSGYEVDGGRIYPVAAVIDDRRIAEHENARVRLWAGKEPPVRYNVYPEDFSTRSARTVDQGLRDVKRWWGGVRVAVAKEWEELRKDLGL